MYLHLISSSLEYKEGIKVPSSISGSTIIILFKILSPGAYRYVCPRLSLFYYGPLPNILPLRDRYKSSSQAFLFHALYI